MKKTPLKRYKGINKISDGRKEQDEIYFPLVAKLWELCKNRSELSGKRADWQSNWEVEPHHIDGRIGDRYTDPFNIIMLTRPEHDKEEGKIRGVKPTDPEILKAIVRRIRLKQGFKEAHNDQQ